MPVLDVGRAAGPRLGRIRRTGLPVPLHLAGGLAAYPHLSLAEKASVGRAALALGRLRTAAARSWTASTSRRGWPERAVRAHHRGPVGPGRRGDAERHRAALPWRWPRRSSRPGCSPRRAPPTSAGPGAARRAARHLARKALEPAGVRAELRAKAESLTRTEDGSWGSRPGDGWRRPSCWPCRRRRPTTCCPGRAGRAGLLLGIGTAPILNVHVVYDRKVLRSRSSRRSAPRCSGSSTAPTPRGSRARAVSGRLAVGRPGRDRRPVAELRARYLPELEQLLPAARGAGDPRLLRHPGAHGDVRPHPRRRTAAARRPHPVRRPVPGRRVDRDRLARDHGGCRAQRRQCRRRGALQPRPPPCTIRCRRRRDVSSTEQEERLCPLCLRLRQAGWTPRTVTALLERGRPLSRRSCGRPWTGSRLPWTPSPPTTSAGSTPRAGPGRRRRQGRAARARPAVRGGGRRRRRGRRAGRGRGGARAQLLAAARRPHGRRRAAPPARGAVWLSCAAPPRRAAVGDALFAGRRRCGSSARRGGPARARAGGLARVPPASSSTARPRYICVEHRERGHRRAGCGGDGWVEQDGARWPGRHHRRGPRRRRATAPPTPLAASRHTSVLAYEGVDDLARHLGRPGGHRQVGRWGVNYVYAGPWCPP
ncbi:hypothetical protein SFIMM107S_07531 [Streptomyces griseus]